MGVHPIQLPQEGYAFDVAKTGCDYTEKEEMELSRLEDDYLANKCFIKSDRLLLASE